MAIAPIAIQTGLRYHAPPPPVRSPTVTSIFLSGSCSAYIAVLADTFGPADSAVAVECAGVAAASTNATASESRTPRMSSPPELCQQLGDADCKRQTVRALPTTDYRLSTAPVQNPARAAE